MTIGMLFGAIVAILFIGFSIDATLTSIRDELREANRLRRDGQ